MLVDIIAGIVRLKRDVSVAIYMKSPLVDLNYLYLIHRIRQQNRKKNVDFEIQ